MRSLVIVCLLVGLVASQTAINYWATCTGDQEQPAVSSPYFGLVAVECTPNDDGSSLITYTVVHTVPAENVTAMHFHAKSNGNVVMGIGDGDGFRGTRGSWNLTSTTHPDVTKPDDMYVNIHSPENPGGELRCDLLEAESTITTATVLTGAQETSPTASQNFGVGIINIVNSSLAEYFAVWTINNATAAHIHGFAELGKNAPVIVNFGISSGDQLSLGTFDPAILTNDTDFTYFNVHTSLNPGGEIRGQNRDVVGPCAPVSGTTTQGASVTNGPASTTNGPSGTTTGAVTGATTGVTGPTAGPTTAAGPSTVEAGPTGPTTRTSVASVTRGNIFGGSSSTTTTDGASSAQVLVALVSLLMAALCL